MRLGLRRMRAHSCLIGLSLTAAAWAQQPMTFPSPADAAKALVEAASKPGLPPLLEIFGAESKDLFPTDQEGKTLREALMQAAAKKVAIDADPTHLGRAILEVGEKGWPFPVPLIQTKDGRWQFDIKEGRSEVHARRLGANELTAITVIAGYVEAQQDYASMDRNGDGVLEYAQRILSTPGQTILNATFASKPFLSVCTDSLQRRWAILNRYTQ